MGMIAPVDSFYVAFFRDDQYAVFPYIFDGQEYEPPGVQIIGPTGLAAWIRRHAKPYLYKMDNGRLLHMGHSFGDDERLSADAIAIPLLNPSPDEPTVIGIASIQTYQPGVYNEEVARAFQSVARSVVTALIREREDLAYEQELSLGDDTPAEPPITIVEAVEDFVLVLERLRAKIDEVVRDESRSREGLLRELTELQEMCQRAQVETTELLMRPSVDTRTFLNRLTPRELEIAQLIADGLANDQIAEGLSIAESTVKTHVTRILKKFGVRQRAAVAAKLRPYE